VARGKKVRFRVAPQALEEMKQRVREITTRNGGRSMGEVTNELGAYRRGWKVYFKLANTPASSRIWMAGSRMSGGVGGV
jgi:RNA-directed DNA polymerase